MLSQKVGPYGDASDNGQEFDHGVFDDVKKVVVGTNRNQVTSLFIDYVNKDGAKMSRMLGNSNDYANLLLVRIVTSSFILRSYNNKSLILFSFFNFLISCDIDISVCG